MLADLFLASPDIDNDAAVPKDALDVKGLDTVKLASLAKAIGVKLGTQSPLDPESGTHWVIPLDAALVGAVAKLDAKARAAAAKTWAATPEWKRDGTPASVAAVLDGFAALAARAGKAKKRVFLRISL